MKTIFVFLACVLAFSNAQRLIRNRRQFATCYNQPGAYCDYNCKEGYSVDPTLRCGVITSRQCCVPTTTLPPDVTTINPDLSRCGISKYGSIAGTMQSSANRVVNGENAYPNEFPWIISLQFDSQHACGGSIVNNQWILTAAHCFTGLNVNSPWTLAKIKVVSGEHRLLDTDGSEHYSSVSKVIIHESYNRWNNSYDIALMKLATPLEINPDQRDICMAAANIGDLNRAEVVASGWGLLEEGASAVPNTLQKAQLYTISNSQCDQTMSDKYGYNIDSTMLCAIGNEKDTCQGDSGGPLIMRSSSGSIQWVQVGVVSWGVGCARPGSPGVYTRVSTFDSWMRNAMADN